MPSPGLFPMWVGEIAQPAEVTAPTTTFSSATTPSTMRNDRSDGSASAREMMA